MTQPILSASSSVTSRPSIPASHLPANTRVPPEAISSSRRLDASLWCSEYQSVARSIALLAQYPIAAPIPITRRVPLLCFVMGRPYPYSVGGVVGVSPRLSGRSSPGGGSSLGGTSSALGGPGGTTPPRGGTASTSSSASGEVGALSSLLLLPLPSSHNKSKISVAIASTPPAPSHTALPYALSLRPVLPSPNRPHTVCRALVACSTALLRLVFRCRNRPHMLASPLSYAISPPNHTVRAFLLL